MHPDFSRWTGRSSTHERSLLSAQYRRVRVALVVTLWLFPVTGWAKSQIERYRFGDTELATIILAVDRESDVVRKLGSQPCVVPGSDRGTVSLFYRSADRTYLQFEVIPDGLESMTMSVDPIIVGVCYAPVEGSLHIGTGKGVHLGDSIEKVIHLYGEPTQQFGVGSLVRLRYYSENEGGRYYEWSLVFRKDRLVEWTAYLHE